MFSDMKNTYVITQSSLDSFVSILWFQLKPLPLMTSSPIHDVITPVLMTSYDLVQLDMIQLTPFYDPAKFYHKRSIFWAPMDQLPDPGSF